jgi:hypothetical protein
MSKSGSLKNLPISLFLAVLRTEPRTLCMLGGWSTADPHPQFGDYVVTNRSAFNKFLETEKR